MKILFLTRKSWPHIGGVEKHIEEIGKRIEKRGNSLKIISEKDIKYPHIKIFGLFYIWFWLFKNRKIILDSDIIHVHDVFVWYLPLRLLYPYKKVFVTIHGLEWDNSFNKVSLLQKRLAVQLSNGSIGIGRFLEKYTGVGFTKILYGGVPNYRLIGNKEKGTFLYVGRLEENTGLGEFLKYLKNIKFKKVDFIGDGRMKGECEKFGKVHGFTDPTKFYKKAEIVVPSGYLTYLEAVGYGCKIKTFYSTPLKKEYWDEILKLKKFMSWDDVTYEYLKLWKR